MKINPLLQLQSFGQSVWLDFIGKGMLTSGDLTSLIRKDGILGVTSNPSIFEKSIAGGSEYDDDIQSAAHAGKTSDEIYDQLTIHDIQMAADLFNQTYLQKHCTDGFVSLEVSPHLAYDTMGTITEARRLWQAVARPNLLVKVPGTREGIPAIQQLISEGININVTLIFSIKRYEEIADAYFLGLEQRKNAGKSLAGIASVASFFLSRIDVAVDALLPIDSPLRGQVAIASAKVAYLQYEKRCSSERFKELEKSGAKPQRLLWASTSTKNHDESDVKYIDALIGPETINTIPLETLNAYRDHGCPENRLTKAPLSAPETLAQLRNFGIDLQKITQQLEKEGVQKFSEAFEKLMGSIAQKQHRSAKIADAKNPLVLSNCQERVESQLPILNATNISQRIWRKDASLWAQEASTKIDIENSLGWLNLPEQMKATPLDDILDFVKEVRHAGFEHVVHMGMGGSSLAALMFARTFACKDGLPLTVLDTTAPSSIQQLEKSLPLEKTLFIVASKSGDTAEPLAFSDYFFALVKALKGENAGENFAAITDPKSNLVKIAEKQKFRRTFLNVPDIGGRYSALSYFGLLPAALMGVDISKILDRAMREASSTHQKVAEKSAPALALGAVLGKMALAGRDKVTLLVDKSVEYFGLWLEQLLAESTGKDGKGIVPIANEPIGTLLNYGKDRLFIHLTQKEAEKDSQAVGLASAVAALRQAGHPVAAIELSDKYDLGGEFFRWEFATAVAASILKINAFDQPNVQESKENTNHLLSKAGVKIPPEQPTLRSGALALYSIESGASGSAVLSQFLKSGRAGDYIALMAFLPESTATTLALQTIRKSLRDKLTLATTLGYGPRFLHSTGQLHKGGPNTGLFLQLTADNTMDIPVPGKPYTFGYFQNAQAQGDLQALHQHQRRALRIHLGQDLERGLQELGDLVNAALRL